MLTVSDFYKKIFSQKVYKIAVDAGCTCPNRDGSLGYGGCIFCSQTGSGDFVPGAALPIEKQIEEAKALVEKKFSRAAARGENVSKKYIVYFQNFTSTYAGHGGHESRLFDLFERAVAAPDVVGIAIVTRPDCLSQEMLAFLGQLSARTYVQIELGFQTANEKTAEYCRRGFKNQVYLQAVESLHEAAKASGGKIHVVSHVIFGLPGDSEEDMLNTVRTVLAAGTDGIKITVLYVVEGTDLAADYRAGKFKTLTKEEYFSLIEKTLPLLPENMVVHRLTGDPPKRILIAPEWTADKKRVLNELRSLYT